MLQAICCKISLDILEHPCYYEGPKLISGASLHPSREGVREAGKEVQAEMLGLLFFCPKWG